MSVTTMEHCTRQWCSRGACVTSSEFWLPVSISSLIGMVFAIWLLAYLEFCQESLQKALDETKSSTSSTEASKDALETEVQQQKDALATLEEKLQEQKQLAEAQQEAKVALEAKLQETFASETALKSEVEATNEASSALEAKFLESQALEASLTMELQQSKEAEAASIQLKNQLMSQLQNADERVSTLTVDLTAAQDGTHGGSRLETHLNACDMYTYIYEYINIFAYTSAVISSCCAI